MCINCFYILNLKLKDVTCIKLYKIRLNSDYSDEKIPIRLLSKIKFFKHRARCGLGLMRIEKNDVCFDFSISILFVYAGCCMVFNRNSH